MWPFDTIAKAVAGNVKETANSIEEATDNLADMFVAASVLGVAAVVFIYLYKKG